LQHAYVMPSLIGLTLYAASTRAVSAGLHLVVGSEVAATAAPSQEPNTLVTTGHSAVVIVAQTPQPGHRVLQGDAIHVTVSHLADTQ